MTVDSNDLIVACGAGGFIAGINDQNAGTATGCLVGRRGTFRCAR
jgi:hypothetical protein